MLNKAHLLNGLFAAFVYGAAGIIFCFILMILYPVLSQGWAQISWEFLITEPRSSGRQGGISSILVANGLILGICLLVACPIGLGTAIFLSEFRHSDRYLTNFVRGSLELLSAVPSIVFGMFGNAFFCKILGLGFSIAAGGLTLACMVLPLLIRTIEDGLRMVPRDLRSGAAALGLSRSSMIRQLLIPLAMPSFAIGLVLGIGRALAETAALIFTSGYVDRMPESLLDSGRSLSVHIYDLAMNVAGGDPQAYASSLTLLGCLLLINVSTTYFIKWWQQARIVI